MSSMKVVVCIKQVPFVEQIKFDAQAGRLIREGVDSEINPFDKRALAQAVELKQKFGAETIVLTMGPPQAVSALREALAMGLDRAVHLLGREFAGSDTLATARALALAIKRLGADLVLCGKYSTDAETGQVPPMLAQLLDLPQVTGVTRLQLDDGGQFTAVRETDEGLETVTGRLPVLLSAAERLIKPIKVAPKDLETVKDRPVETLGAKELSDDPSSFGVSGSPTWVEAIYSIEPHRKRIVRPVDQDLEATVRATVADLLEEGVLGGIRSLQREAVKPHPARSRPGKAIWVVAELAAGQVRHVTFELLGRATELADKIDGEVAAVLLGSSLREHVSALAAHGADRVYVADSPDLANYLTEPYTQVLASAMEQYRPWAVLIPSTAVGRDLAPRVAARLNLGLTGDCIGLEIDEKERLVQLKPAFGGNIVAPILTRTRPAMATIRPGIMQKAAAQLGRAALVESLPADRLSSRIRFISSEIDTEQAIEMDDADVIIGVGMGIGGPENLPLVENLAGVLGASLGATRRVVDAGWLPRQVQIGLTGRSVAPPLYLALGVRGAFNHTVGIQRSGVVLAINRDPESEIFKHCDYGLVGDWQAIVSALIKALAEQKEAVQAP